MVMYLGEQKISPIIKSGAVINNQDKTITPTTSLQSITVPSGYSGFGTLTVNAVTSSIDSDIKSSNIKSGVNILGVNGSVVELAGETRSVSLTSSSGNTFTPSSGKNGITSITVTPNNQARTVTPTTSQQSLTVGSGYSGNGTITVNAVTSSIDNNITAGNIKKDVTILGVTGTYEGVGGVDNIDLSNITNNSLTDYAFRNAFKNCKGIVSVNLSGLVNLIGLDRTGTGTSIRTYTNSFSSAFMGCTSLTIVNMSNLTSIKRYNTNQYTSAPSNLFTETFSGCTSLTSIDLSSLTIVEGQAEFSNTFRNCTSLSSANFNSLVRINSLGYSSCKGTFANCFRGCTNLTTVSFPNLEEVYAGTGIDYNQAIFVGWDGVQKMYFPKLSVLACYDSTQTTSLVRYTFKNCDSLTELHFGAENQSAIEASEAYSTAWGRGAGNVTIYFDL